MFSVHYFLFICASMTLKYSIKVSLKKQARRLHSNDCDDGGIGKAWVPPQHWSQWQWWESLCLYWRGFVILPVPFSVHPSIQPIIVHITFQFIVMYSSDVTVSQMIKSPTFQICCSLSGILVHGFQLAFQLGLTRRELSVTRYDGVVLLD
jgi:hypothetical protein